jgi:hypothetical protein
MTGILPNFNPTIISTASTCFVKAYGTTMTIMCGSKIPIGCEPISIYLLRDSRIIASGNTSGATTNIPSANNFHVIHTAHCVDALRQKLMCEADMHVMPWHRPVNGKRISLAFDRVAQCHDFRETANFARTNQYKGIKLVENSFEGH